jgi:hypothetical protein
LEDVFRTNLARCQFFAPVFVALSALLCALKAVPEWRLPLNAFETCFGGALRPALRHFDRPEKRAARSSGPDLTTIGTCF